MTISKRIIDLKYLSNPSLFFHPKAPKNWQGNPIDGKEFQYVRNAYNPEFTDLLKMIFSPNPQRKEKKNDKWIPPVSADVSYLEDRTEDWVVWLGHASYLMQINGLRFLTDPQLTDMPLIPRRVFPPFTYDEIRGVDYLLLSHDHRDHVDKKCIKGICKNNPIKKILCPLKLSGLISGWVGDTPIEEAGWYQIFDTAETGVRITYLPSQHWCRRGLTDFNQILWGGFMLEVAENAGAKKVEIAKTIYFGGDSAKTDYWAEIGAMFPNIDLAILGIGAYKPDFMMEPVHSTPPEAHQGYLDLKAHYYWPMHHGTYDLSNEPASEPIRWSKELMLEAGLGERLVQPEINERWWF
ncbi:MAG: L-ascorbate metabolism protein UlaG (beta-lactamase superfamily) [Neolewinella sp.]